MLIDTSATQVETSNIALHTATVDQRRGLRPCQWRRHEFSFGEAIERRKSPVRPMGDAPVWVPYKLRQFADFVYGF